MKVSAYLQIVKSKTNKTSVAAVTQTNPKKPKVGARVVKATIELPDDFWNPGPLEITGKLEREK